MTFILDSEIQDEEILYRAIHPNFWNEEENRPSSALFKDNRGVSVDRDGKRNVEDIVSLLLSNRENYGVGNLNAGETRKVGAYLKPDKTIENDYHALILTSESKLKLSNSIARILSKKIIIVNPPQNSE